MIKNPIDFVIGIFNQFDMGIGDLDDERRERLNMVLFDFTALLQMEYFGHPTVAGWKAYYQEPAFYQSWINSVTLPLRSYITDLLALNGAAYGDRRLIIDIFGLLDSLENAYDVNEMIEDLGNLLFPLPLSELQMASLKEVLIPGLPDFEWTIEYSQYKSDPQDEEVKRSVEQKLRAMLVYILRSPEYQLS